MLCFISFNTVFFISHLLIQQSHVVSRDHRTGDITRSENIRLVIAPPQNRAASASSHPQSPNNLEQAAAERTEGTGQQKRHLLIRRRSFLVRWLSSFFICLEGRVGVRITTLGRALSTSTLNLSYPEDTTRFQSINSSSFKHARSLSASASWPATRYDYIINA